MIGQTILHYEILEKVGEGGMGVVYKAQDAKLDRIVALKFLPTHLHASEPDKARFMQEAKAAAALNHPNICVIHAIEELDGRLFIVMEYVDGQTLNEKKGAISFKQAIDIGVQIADGLAAAHEKGIIHRDIKPENIMIRKDGIVQIMDFGLAKLRGVTRLTKEGSTVGTAGYMSPEQIQGQDVDHRSDIFSLGVVLYELFTGQLPFKGLHETALSYEIVNVDAPSMSSVKPDIDPALDAIVLECLEKDPNERTQSARQVSVDLTRFRRGSSRQRASRSMPAKTLADQRTMLASDRSAKAVGLKRFAWPVSILLFVLGAALILWKGIPGTEARSKDVMRSTYIPATGQSAATIDISPDGKRIAYVGLTATGQQVFVRALSDLEARPISGTQSGVGVSGYASVAFFSRDGEWLGFVNEGKLKKISLHGGSAIPLCPVSFLRGATWADDNSIVFAPDPTSCLWRISADGGTPYRVTTLDSSAGEISHRYPEVLPGSKAVLFTVKTNAITKFSDARIAVQRFDSKEKKILIEGGSFVRYISTGHLLFGRGGSIYAVPFDPDRLELKGSPIPVLDGGMFVESWGVMTMAISQSGTLVYAPGGPVLGDSNSVMLYDRKGHARSLVASPGSYGSVAVSPDRQRIVTYMNAANDDIWVYDIQRRLPTRFTFGGGNNWYPLWTPDGKRIVYTAERGGPANLFWKSADGGGTEERLASGVTTQFPGSWTSDGKLLAFHQVNADGNSDVWILPVEGDRRPRPFLQSRFDEEYASFSPDGHWLAYQSNESGQPEVYVVPFPTGEGKSQISTGGGIYSHWAKGGREIIYYRPSTKSFMRVPITYGPDLRPGSGEELFRLPDDPFYRPDISPDGEHIAVVLGGQQMQLTKLVVVVNWFEELKKQLASK
jgi:Tol biopolymer transport system component/predicted Ser/Thr protein kinase